MKIFSKFLLTFLFLSLVPLLVISGYAYREWSNYSREAVVDRLQEVLASKMEAVEQFLQEVETDVTFISRTKEVADVVRSPSEKTKKALNEILGYYSRTFGLEDTFLVKDDGEIVYSLRNIYRVENNIFRDELKGSELEKTVLATIRSKQTEISRFDIYPVNNKALLFVSSPIIDRTEILGTLVFAIEGKRIYDIFDNYRSLGETGEVLIGMKKDNHAVFINPIRHDPNSAFTRKVELGSDIAFPIQDAVQTQPGKGVSVDYRGAKILAVWQYFPKMNWGMVAKIDLKEALKPVEYLQDLLLLVGTITTLVVIIIAVIISRIFAKPIHALCDVADKVGSGNLDVRSTIKSRDEFGLLSESFNRMVEGLKESTTSVNRLNEEIAKRDQSEKMRAEMLSRVSHELRTPLTPIQEGVSMVLSEKEGPLTPQQKELLQLAQNNTKRLSELIASILHLQEPGKELDPSQKGHVDLKGVLSKVAADYRHAAEQKKLHFKAEIAQDLPAIAGDAAQIESALKELVDNAIKFTDSGDVILSGKKESDTIQLAVKDSGMGIPKEEQEHLFEGFRELDMSFDRKVQGKGLGLAAVKKVAEIHGGNVQVHSEGHGGSTFILTLPIGAKNG